MAAITLFFKVDHIEVTGNSRYTADEVIASSGIGTGDNLFLLNKFEVAEKIRTTLPYIEAVRISRHLPTGLGIEVTECTNTVGVEQDGQLWLLCSSGKLVDVIPAAEETTCVRVTGVVLTEPQTGQSVTCQDETAGEQLLELLKQLESKEMLGQVQEIHLENPGVITMRYAEDFTVELPWHTDFDYKLNYLLAVLEKLEENEKGTIILTQDGEARFIPE